jgi:hypothetical protein
VFGREVKEEKIKFSAFHTQYRKNPCRHRAWGIPAVNTSTHCKHIKE